MVTNVYSVFIIELKKLLKLLIHIIYLKLA